MSVTPEGFDHRVGWREFSRVAERPGSAAEDAEIDLNTDVSYDWGWGGSNYVVTEVRPTISVNEAASWVLQGKESRALLEHEQGHYDITALGVREEAKLVSELSASSGAHLERARAQIRTRIQRKIDAANDRYDARTNHGDNQAVQRRWLRAISRAKSRDEGTIDDLPN